LRDGAAQRGAHRKGADDGDTRAWTNETWGRKNQPAGDDSVLKGSGGEGAPEGWAPRGSGAEAC
jgi:hypothetical protein